MVVVLCPVFSVSLRTPGARGLVFLILTLGLIVVRGPVQAQSRIDVATARAYAQSLDRNFWEQAWGRHLEDGADRDGSIDWHYGDRQQLSELTDEYQRAIGASNGFLDEPAGTG